MKTETSFKVGRNIRRAAAPKKPTTTKSPPAKAKPKKAAAKADPKWKQQKLLLNPHALTCDYCPVNDNPAECKKVALPETGVCCCQCSECFDLPKLLAKEITRNEILAKNYEKKLNQPAVQAIEQDLLDATACIFIDTREALLDAYRTLKNNS